MKTIQWFPGHMNKTRNKMKEFLSQTDLVVEVIDARIPRSSRNPVIRDIFHNKPFLILLNKTDLADPKVTDKWINYFHNQPDTKALAVSSIEPGGVKKIIPACLALGRKRLNTISALIAGVPNSGKSSVINAVNKSKKAGVQNKPGHTKDFQRIIVSRELHLIDTPGLLWTKFENQQTGINLAIMGSIKDEILDIPSLAAFAAEFLAKSYPEYLRERYTIEELAAEASEIIGQIGRKRGFLVKGGGVDYDRAAALLINELRGGKLGRISLESPETDL
ncbi:MAG: ribosome biogenesis GTPase YlqF [Spirochaetales bacterium]|nr:ribosome biogenesis GTPase YlqF [Spirochaetales bacterium]